MILQTKQNCPICYNNSRTFYKTVCGHQFCQQCFQDFIINKQKNSLLCPFCLMPIHESQILEDKQDDEFQIQYKAEIQTRELLKLEFNESQDDFEDLQQYNQYLELIETVGKIRS